MKIHPPRLARARALAACGAVVFAGAALCSCLPGPPGEDVSGGPRGASEGSTAVPLAIAGASSTRVMNDALSERAAAQTPPLHLDFNNAGSSTLVQQLADGAPADVLLTASRATMDQAVKDGTVTAPVELASNHMVMVVPRGNPAGISSVADLSTHHTFVACDPQVPCGDITAKLSARNHLTLDADSLEHQVADVLGKVASGEADAGWVYSTDAAAAGESVEVIDIPGADEFSNAVMGAVTTSSAHPEEAQALLTLIDTDFNAEWKRHGFDD